MTNPEPQSGPADLPLVLDVHLAALQEIDRVVGNENTLGVEDTTRLRGILHAAMSRPRPVENPIEGTP